MSNGKVVKFAGVPVLSVRFFKKCEGTLPRRRLGSKVNFFSTRRDTVNFAFVYHGVSMYFIRCIITFWNTTPWTFKVNTLYSLHVFHNRAKYSITLHQSQLLSKHWLTWILPWQNKISSFSICAKINWSCNYQRRTTEYVSFLNH